MMELALVAALVPALALLYRRISRRNARRAYAAYYQWVHTGRDI